MKTFVLYHPACQFKFELQHPSISTRAEMMGVTLDCPRCERIVICKPEDMQPTGALYDPPDLPLELETMTEKMRRQLQLHINETLGEEDGSLLADEPPHPTPAMMPMKRPTAPKKPKPERKDHLTQRPFAGLKDLLK